MNKKQKQLDLLSEFWTLFIQAIPLVVILPLRKLVAFFFFAFIWTELMRTTRLDQVESLISSIIITKISLSIAFPLLGICAKWIIVGKYKSGRYPLFGTMYLRWWLVDKIQAILGRGMFEKDIPFIGSGLRWYYILQGAEIGPDFKLSKQAKIGQPDLLFIGSHVTIENSLVRPFALEEGHFILLPIIIGDSCSVGDKSSIAPGTIVPANTHIGPHSSSYEMYEDADSSYYKYCRQRFPGPSRLWKSIGYLIIAVVRFARYLPWYFIILEMVKDGNRHGWYATGKLENILEVIFWWTTPERIVYYFILRVLEHVVDPLLEMALVILIKRNIIGTFKPGHQALKSPWGSFQYWLMVHSCYYFYPSTHML